MKLELRARGVRMTDKLKTHIETRLRNGFGRFGDKIEHVRVYLTDLNGPKGGEDIQCHLQAKFSPGGELVIRETRGDPFAAVAYASKRASRNLRRQLGRWKMRRKGRS